MSGGDIRTVIVRRRLRGPQEEPNRSGPVRTGLNRFGLYIKNKFSVLDLVRSSLNQFERDSIRDNRIRNIRMNHCGRDTFFTQLWCSTRGHINNNK